MAVSYKKLFKLMIDKEINKTQLREKAGITSNAMAKISKNENVNTEVIVKICVALNCDVGDIMEIVDDVSIPKGNNSEGEARQ